jgi:hypothetical protein
MKYQGHWVHARFANNDKSLIEAVLEQETADGEIDHSGVVIRVNMEDEDFQSVLEVFSLDQIEEMTKKHIAERTQVYLDMVKKIATDAGLIFDAEKINRFGNKELPAYFSAAENDSEAEYLFDLKLSVFEMPEVYDSTNDDLKRQLREADTIAKTLYVAGKFLYE